MRKKFAASLAIVVGALGAAGLARAEGADDPSYPALAPIRSVNTRAQVQATAHAADALQSQSQASADGASYPALASIRSVATRSEVRAAAYADAAQARTDRLQASADGATYPALQDVRARHHRRAEPRMQAHRAVGASEVGGRYSN